MSFLKGLQGLSQSMKGSLILQWTAALFAGLAGLSLIALPFGILGASLFSVVLGFRALASVARVSLIALRPFIGIAQGIIGGLVGGAIAFGRMTGLAYRFAGALGAAAVAFRGLRKLLGVGLVIEAFSQIWENWDRIKALVKDPLKVDIIFPEAPWWLQKLLGGVGQIAKDFADIGQGTYEPPENPAQKSLPGIIFEWMESLRKSLGLDAAALNQWSPAFAGIGQVGVPEAMLRNQKSDGQAGATGNVAPVTETNNVTSNSHNTVNVGGVTVNVTSNADPHAIGAAAASAIGNKVRGALSDAPHSAP